MADTTSRALFERAQQLIPGGVNSPVRAFKAVGGVPFFVRKARGSRLYDVEGRVYIDYVGSWGPMIFGHAHPEIIAAVRAAARDGTSFGMPTEREVELAALIAEMVPCVEMVRLTSSGTEACMSALRLARGYTGRDLVVKFAGCYHGASDAVLVEAGSGVATLGIPGTPGVPAAVAANTLIVPFNDLAAVRAVFDAHAGRIAAVMVEPVAGNMGVVPPAEGFLEGLRAVCDEQGTLLIFDEVMTGFRVAPGGAQERYGVLPDLCTLGKIVGGGMPLAAFGGRAEIMRAVAPAGPIYQAGTLSGNPVATAAGQAALELLRAGGVYEHLEEKSARLEQGLRQRAAAVGLPVTINRVGSMLTVFFTPGPVIDYTSAKQSNTRAFAAFFHSMLGDGISLPPSQFEAWFVSMAHSNHDIYKTIRAAEKGFRSAAGVLA